MINPAIFPFFARLGAKNISDPPKAKLNLVLRLKNIASIFGNRFYSFISLLNSNIEIRNSK
ncbi:MAG: hypothetical protein ACQEUB_14465, partial [Thermodesulfobacteriota bacterium]